MSRLLACLALAVLVVQPALAAGPPAGTDVVAREAWEGDTAVYAFTRSFTGPDGATTVERRDDVTMVWEQAAVRLWTGDEATLLGLRVAWHDDSWVDGSNQVAFQRIDLYETLPGERVASEANLTWNDGLPSETRSANAVTRHVVFDSGPCGGEVAPLLAGRSVSAAQVALRACHGRDDRASVEGVAAAWTDDERLGRSLVFTVTGHEPADEGTLDWSLAVRTSPLVSMPLEVVRRNATMLPTGRAVIEDRLVIVGWRDGGDPLPGAVAALPPRPTVALVPWSQTGPGAADLTWLPVAEARRVTAATPMGADFFATHAEARFESLWFQGDYQRANLGPPATEPRGTYLSECTRPHQDAVDASAASAGPAPARAMNVRWSDHAASLTARVASTALEPTGDVRQVAPVGDPRVGPPTAEASPLIGPSLADLMTTIPLVEGLGGSGRLHLFVKGPTAPEDPWVFIRDNRRIAVPAGETALRASVVLADCGPEATGSVYSREHGITFVDGVAVYLWDITSHQFARPIQGFAVADAPSFQPWAPTDDAVPTWRPGWWAVGIGVVAALALAARFAAALYTRLTTQRALEHPVRERFIQLIRAEPGITLPVLAKRLGIHRSSADHHLRMLERVGHVRVTRTWRGFVVHAAGDPDARWAGVMARAHAPELLAEVRARPGIHVMALAAKLGISKGKASGLATLLVDAGLLARQRDGRRVCLVVTPDGQRLVPAAPDER